MSGARTLRIAIVGFGHVGRRFATHLLGPYRRALRAEGVTLRVTGIATARHGTAIDADGLALAGCLQLVTKGGSLDTLHRGARVTSSRDFVRRVPADVLVELTPLDPRRGEPAISHVRMALRRGLHVVTANKGPVAFAWRPLLRLANSRGVSFLHEGAVMDGIPVFNLVQRCLPGTRVLGFRGVLNSTTSHVLSRMERGVSRKAAVREAQAAGIAEADPGNDLEGWDAAVKGCALANALMRASIRPAQVERRGITGVTTAAVGSALRRGKRIRLVTRARRRDGHVAVSVAPERLPIDDPLARSGADAMLVLETDLAGEVGVYEGKGTVDQTAYAVLSDLFEVVRRTRGRSATRN